MAHTFSHRRRGLTSETAAKASTVATAIASAKATATSAAAAKAATATTVSHAVHAGTHGIGLATTVAAARAVEAGVALLRTQVRIGTGGLVVVAVAALTITELAGIAAFGGSLLIAIALGAWSAVALTKRVAALAMALGAAIGVAFAAFGSLLALAEREIGPLSDDIATLYMLTELARAAGRPDIAEHYVRRLLHLALALAWLSALQARPDVALTRRTMARWGLSRDAAGDGLRFLQHAGLLRCWSAPGRARIVILYEPGGDTPLAIG